MRRMAAGVRKCDGCNGIAITQPRHTPSQVDPLFGELSGTKSFIFARLVGYNLNALPLFGVAGAVSGNHIQLAHSILRVAGRRKRDNAVQW